MKSDHRQLTTLSPHHSDAWIGLEYRGIKSLLPALLVAYLDPGSEQNHPFIHTTHQILRPLVKDRKPTRRLYSEWWNVMMTAHSWLCTAVCNVLATSANRAPNACATKSRQNSALKAVQCSQTIPNLKLRLYRSKRKLGFKSGMLKVAALVAHALGALLADVARTLNNAVLPQMTSA